MGKYYGSVFTIAGDVRRGGYYWVTKHQLKKLSGCLPSNVKEFFKK